MKSIHFEICDSTNTRAKEYLKNTPEQRLVVTADCQSAGRGRQGKSFYSPDKTGVYMTYVFRASLSPLSAVSVTTAAAAAVYKALEKISGKTLQIKWVNDIYLDGKKICGILAENILGTDGLTEYIIIGVGINLCTEQFPGDIKNTAANLGNYDKNEIISAVKDGLECIANAPLDRSFMNYYRERSIVIGKDIIFYENGDKKEATVSEIDDSGALHVLLQDGTTQILASGEITLRLQ